MFILYSMLKGVRIYTSDVLWRQILSDFGASVLDAPNSSDINFDALDVPPNVSPMELKALILAAVDNSGIMKKIFGTSVILPRMQGQIVTLLYKTGGMRAPEIRSALGYSPNAATHTVDTAIYQLRRAYGRDFIINDNGVYRLGKL